MPIHFHKENIRFRLNHREALEKWILLAIKTHKFKVETINFIFCSDNYLLKLNKQFLNHHYFTDIITFNNSTEEKKLNADIYISIDRVKSNSEKFKVTFNDELHRVLIHGVLHLSGYDDKNEKNRIAMKKAEDLWLSKRKF